MYNEYMDVSQRSIVEWKNQGIEFCRLHTTFSVRSGNICVCGYTHNICKQQWYKG